MHTMKPSLRRGALSAAVAGVLALPLTRVGDSSAQIETKIPTASEPGSNSSRLGDGDWGVFRGLYEDGVADTKSCIDAAVSAAVTAAGERHLPSNASADKIAAYRAGAKQTLDANRYFAIYLARLCVSLNEAAAAVADSKTGERN